MSMIARPAPLLALLALLALLLVGSVAQAQPERQRRAADVRLEEVRSKAAELIDRAATYDPLSETETRADPVPEAELLLARVTRYADPKRDIESFIVAAHALRATRAIAELDSAVIERTLPALLQNEELSREVLFARWAQYDKAPAVFGVLDEMIAEHGAKEIAKAPRLAAALCIVHDTPQGFRANENVAQPEKPGTLFAYFASARMNGLTRKLSPELLAWVVDTVDAHELSWANQRFAGKANTGTLFHNIQYDMDHFLQGRPKKVTEQGFNLPNIAEFGGVCIDQAFFACHVGRAIGVPSAVCTGQGSNVGHAWVGYLRVRGSRAWWDFDEGRYADYAKVRGSVTDPQRRTRVPDGEAAARAASYGLRPDTRHLAIALVDASALIEKYPAGWTDDVVPFVGKDTEAREASLETRMDLLERAATLNAGELRAWKQVQAIASTGAMNDAMKNRWADAAMRLAGTDFMEFAVDFAKPLVETVEDPDARSMVLGRLFDYCKKDRPGVAAEIMLDNATLYEAAGNTERAYEAYAFVATEYADVSNLAVQGLAKATTMLHEHGHHKMAADLARKAWGRTKQPDFSPEFAGQSNWTRIGRILASSLRQANDTNGANAVDQQISGLMGR